MLHIAICDDEQDFVQHLKTMLNQYADETGEEIKITAYYDGMELIGKYDTIIDLIFLDIQMEGVDGLKAAEQIRKKDENVGIIFLTSLKQYALDNAIEACEKLAEDERFITVKAGVKNQFLLIQVENSAAENNETGHTAKGDGFLHGFGKKNIQRAVEKYHGHCKWSFEQGVYSLSILIPLPQ